MVLNSNCDVFAKGGLSLETLKAVDLKKVLVEKIRFLSCNRVLCEEIV